MRKIVLFSKIENVSMWWHNERYPITLIRPHLYFAVCIRLSFSVFVSWITVSTPPPLCHLYSFGDGGSDMVDDGGCKRAHRAGRTDRECAPVAFTFGHSYLLQRSRGRERTLTTHQSQSKYPPNDTHTFCVCRRKIFGNNSLDLIEHVRTIQIHINKTLSFHLTSFLSLI